VKFKGDYIELLVPLTLTIPIENSPIAPRLYVGPAVSFLLSAKITNGGEVDIKDSTEDIDYGIFFGGGADYMIGNGALMLDVLYNIGLANIDKEADAEGLSVTNKTIQIMAGYRFFLGN
jgi:hypothetical protein